MKRKTFKAPKRAADLWRGMGDPEPMPLPHRLRQDVHLPISQGASMAPRERWRMAQYAYAMAHSLIGDDGPIMAEVFSDVDAAAGDCATEIINGDIPWINRAGHRRRHVSSKAAVRLTRGNRIVAVVEIPGDPEEQTVLCRVEGRAPRFGDVVGLHYGPRGLEGVYVLTAKPRYALDRRNLRHCCAYVDRRTAFAETEAALADLFGLAA